VDKVIHCDCGFEARFEDEERLVAEIQRHAREAHGMTLSHEQGLLLAFRAQLGETAWSHVATRGEASVDTNEKEER
jgi:Protein of unknown function (DUF1059)